MLSKVKKSIMAYAFLFCAGFSPLAFAWSLGQPGTENEGWVLDNNGERYFAIGLWGVPGYTFVRKAKEPTGNDSLFARETGSFNLLTIQSGFQKPYMQKSGRAFSSGLVTFRYLLSETGYVGTVPLADDDDLSNDNLIPYHRMRSIRDNIDKLAPYVCERIVIPLASEYRDSPFIHFIMDEPDTGGRGWYWHPSIIRLYHNIAHDIDEGTLTYIDLGGNVSANRFFYEKAFGDTFRIGTNPAKGACNPDNMDTYNVASDGTTLYDYRRGIFGGKWERKPLENFRHLFYDNIMETSAAYDNSCDVIGLNSYQVFREYPETAGEVVDAIKDGCGSGKPVWLFFDGAADQKPRGMSFEDYASLVRCQVYTSLIHGASGVNIYAITRTEAAETEYWPHMRELAEELEVNSNIIRLPVIDAYWDSGYHTAGYDHLHWSVRGEENNQRWLIVSNTSRTRPLTCTVKGFPEVTVGPLEGYVISSINEQ